MKRISWVVLTVVGAVACAPDTNQGFYVVGNKALSASCLIDGGEKGLFVSRGTVDVLLTSQYTMGAIIKNNMTSSLVLRSRKATDGRLEANTIQVQRAVVKYTYPDEAQFQGIEAQVGSSHTEFVSLFLPPGAAGPASVPLMKPSVDGLPSLAKAMFDALGPREVTNPAPSVILRTEVTMFGEMSDGTEIEAQPFVFPLQVCKGCLLVYPLAAKLGEGPLNCRNEEQPPTERPCRVGQDDPVDCRICRESKPIALRNDCEPF